VFVHAKFGCAGGEIAGIGYEIANGRIPITIGIAEMVDRQSELVFEKLLAGTNFFARGLWIDLCKAWMCQRM